jgi:putative ABC transport system substrate-binding protein
MMRRRELIAGLLCIAAMKRAEAQQKATVYRIAVVSPSDPVSELNETGHRYYRAFFQTLRQLGYVEGRNLTVERYSGEGQSEDFSKLAADVVRSRPDLIHAAGNRMASALNAATNTIPIVATLGDPVAGGLVRSMARPGGNITGTTVEAGSEIMGKYLELLREIAPASSRVAWLASRRLWDMSYAPVLAEVTQRTNISLIGPPLDAPIQEAEYRRVFAAMVQGGADALIVSSQPENLAHRRLIVELATEARLPAIYPYPDFAEIGGLMALGVDLAENSRYEADQIDKILKGTNAGEIPLYQPNKLVLAINLKSAKALGITVPPTLLIAADEVIE